MVGNITVGVVIVLIIAGIIFGCQVDKAGIKDAEEKDKNNQ